MLAAYVGPEGATVGDTWIVPRSPIAPRAWALLVIRSEHYS